MKKKDLEKTIEELQEEKENNNKQILINYEKTKLSYANQFDYTAGGTIFLSMIPYLILILLSGIFNRTGIMEFIMKIIPFYGFPFVVAGGSIWVGFILEKLIEKKKRIKERFEEFSRSKSQVEKLQDEIEYAIELEKAKSRNKAIQQAIDSLNEKRAIFDSLSDKYDIIDKIKPITEEECQKQIDEISSILKKLYDELDVLSTQKVLHEYSWKVRMKYNKIFDTISAGMIGGLFTFMYSTMPLLSVLKSFLVPVPHLISLFTVDVPLILGIIGGCLYMVKKNKKYEKVFNIFNSSLGDNALPKKIINALKEQKEIDKKIYNKVNEISDDVIQLQEQKRIMESFTNSNFQEERTLDLPVSKRYTITLQDDISSYDQQLEEHPYVLEKK